MEEGFTRGLIRILINLLKKFSLKSDTEFTFYSYKFFANAADYGNSLIYNTVKGI